MKSQRQHPGFWLVQLKEGAGWRSGDSFGTRCIRDYVYTEMSGGQLDVYRWSWGSGEGKILVWESSSYKWYLKPWDWAGSEYKEDQGLSPGGSDIESSRRSVGIHRGDQEGGNGGWRKREGVWCPRSQVKRWVKEGVSKAADSSSVKRTENWLLHLATWKSPWRI